MLIKKSNKRIKKMMARIRMRRVQIIMNAMRTHQKSTLNTVKASRKRSNACNNAARTLVKRKVVKLKGILTASRGRSRNLIRGKSK